MLRLRFRRPVLLGLPTDRCFWCVWSLWPCVAHGPTGIPLGPPVLHAQQMCNPTHQLCARPVPATIRPLPHNPMVVPPQPHSPGIGPRACWRPMMLTDDDPGHEERGRPGVGCVHHRVHDPLVVLKGQRLQVHGSRGGAPAGCSCFAQCAAAWQGAPRAPQQQQRR
jgi:hypothetical protein